MATIKKGTYRFHDVLTQLTTTHPETGYNEVSLPFTFTANLGIEGYENTVFTCSTIYQEPRTEEQIDSNGVGSLQFIAVASIPDLTPLGFNYPLGRYVWSPTDGWSLNGAQTITITEDTEVSADFYAWFSANAVADGVQISGKWKFKVELTAEDGADIKQSVNFHYDLSGADFGVDIDVRFYCSGLRVFWQSAYYDFNWLLVDIDRIEPSQVDVGGTAYDVATAIDYTVPGDNPIHKESWNIPVVPTIDFGTEPQTVSAEFYNWLTANATQPTASITYNGTTIANLFDGQKATLKCEGMVMEDDVVVEVAEQTGGGGCDKPPIVEVYEWPTENIDENLIYKRRCPTTMIECKGETPEEIASVSANDINDFIYSWIGVRAVSYCVKTNEELETVPKSADIVPVVYVESTKRCLIYFLGTWTPAEVIFGEPDTDTEFTPVNSEEEAIAMGLGTYMVIDHAYGRYVDGQWNIVEPRHGTRALTRSDAWSSRVDVRKYAYACTDIPQVYVVADKGALPESAPYGSVAMILGGE